MAGHSKWKNIMHRKGAQDAKRAKQFTKVGREISVAARSGMLDPEHNPRLRAAIQAARGVNMGRDAIERAIKRATGGEENVDYLEMRYEGYGPGGIALIVEALTDNRNRTASEVRSAFNKAGGSMGETGSVSFMFERLGQVVFNADVGDADTVFEAAFEAGATDVASDDDGHTALHWACDAGHMEVARCLLEYGAAPDAQNVDGSTPMHMACVCEHHELARLLLERGADVGLRDGDGQSPADLAPAAMVEALQLK